MSRIVLVFVVCGLAGCLVGARAFAQESSLPPAGVLTIEFGNSDQLRFAPVDGSAIVVPFYDLRDATGSPKDACALGVGDYPDGQDDSLLSLAATGSDRLGFNVQKDWIGIRKQKRGVDCGRVVTGEGIGIALGDAPELAGLKVVNSILELNVKKNAVIDLVLKADGEVTGYYQVRSGTEIVTGMDNVFNCAPGADSGPDVDSACRVDGLEVVWDALELTTAAGNGGEWSLGAGTSMFELAQIDGILDCKETTIVAEDPDSDAFVQLRRLDNIDGSACVAIPYTLSFGDQTVTFLADYLGQDESVAFEWTVTWAPEALVRPAETDPLSAATALAGIPVSTQVFRDGVDDHFPIDVCLGMPVFDAGDGLLIGIDLPVGESFPDMSADQFDEFGELIVEGMPGTQYGCLLDRQIEYLGSDEVQVRESGYLQGDWISSRSF